MSQGLVIPCFNESKRLPFSEVRELLNKNPDLSILFVDDGSMDDTRQVIENFSKESPRLSTLSFETNQGKAEAVRQGLLRSLEAGHECVGFADADFATPAFELLRLIEIWKQRRPHVLMGSRVRLLGTEIERQGLRHYLGRVFATMASMALRLPVYDTQCGAKFFSATPILKETLAQRFKSRWVFDVELLGRLCKKDQLNNKGEIIEVPLQKWTDIKGSKLKASAMIFAAFDLLRIAIELRMKASR